MSGETAVTFISQVIKKGWVLFNTVFDCVAPGMLKNQLNTMLQAANTVKEEDERLIRNFVFRQLDFGYVIFKSVHPHLEIESYIELNKWK